MPNLKAVSELNTALDADQFVAEPEPIELVGDELVADTNAVSRPFELIAPHIVKALAAPMKVNFAHFIAALFGADSGIDLNKLSMDAKEDLAICRAQLDRSGHLEAYKRDGGRLDIW